MTLPTSASGFFVSRIIPDQHAAAIFARVVAGSLSRCYDVPGSEHPGQRVVATHPWRGAYPVDKVCDACMEANRAPLSELFNGETCGCVLGKQLWMTSELVTHGLDPRSGRKIAQIQPTDAERALGLLACLRWEAGGHTLVTLLHEIAGLPLARERDEEGSTLPSPLNIAITPCPEVGMLSVYVQDRATLREYLHFYAHDAEFVLRMAAIVLTRRGFPVVEGFDRTGLWGHAYPTGPAESWIKLATIAAGKLPPSAVLSALASGMALRGTWDPDERLRAIARAAVLQTPAPDEDLDYSPHSYLALASDGDPKAIRDMARGMWLHIDLPAPEGRWEWAGFTGDGLRREDGHTIATEGHAPATWAGLMALADATVPFNQTAADSRKLREAGQRLSYITSQLAKLNEERAKLDAEHANLTAEHAKLTARLAASPTTL